MIITGKKKAIQYVDGGSMQEDQGELAAIASDMCEACKSGDVGLMKSALKGLVAVIMAIDEAQDRLE